MQPIEEVRFVICPNLDKRAKEKEMCNPGNKLDLILSELKSMNALLVKNLNKDSGVQAFDSYKQQSKIAAIQKVIGVPADGIPGPQTKATLRSLGL